jgi:hypothetical protein
MMRRSDGNEPVAPAVACFSLQSAESSADSHLRVLAAVMVQLRPPPPQPSTSSTVTPPAVAGGRASAHDEVDEQLCAVDQRIVLASAEEFSSETSFFDC